MAFDPKKYLIKVQGGRQYLPVSARLIWFRSEHPDWGVDTEAVAIDTERQYAIFRARIYNADGKLMAVGTKMENVKGFPDYLEKAETGAVGRALALCGYGTQFSPELDEVAGNRLADSPQPMGGSRYGGNPSGGSRYGSGGNNTTGRFAPPREVSAPAEDREAPAAHPKPESAPRRPEPTAATDEEDDFEALITDDVLLTADEDDPFGEETPAEKPMPSVPVSRPAAPAAAAGTPACTSCGKALTKAQQDLSIRNYGEALCPTCQKDKGRAKRPALAER